jgi:release factor glutamine methyltransferase
MPHTINQTIQLAQTHLTIYLNLSKDEAKFEVQLLLQHVLKVNHAWLIAHTLDTVQDDIYRNFEALLKRRLNGEPIAYILGYREFFGLQLKVTADTLIPRPDTETLVEAALAKIPQIVRQAQNERDLQTNHEANLQPLLEQDLLVPARPELVKGCSNERFRILDLGTGSGAIALAIAKHSQNAQITAVDASQAALSIAIENAQHLNIKNVHFVLSNWFNALNDEKFDVIVSNPPYIEADDGHLTQGDLRFEPQSALASGADGFDDIRIIINHSPNYLKSNGWLMLEHGYNQAEYVAELLAQNGFHQISHVKDLAGISRVTIGCYVDD